MQKSKAIALKAVEKVLRGFISIDTQASCIGILHQPKQPANLATRAKALKKAK
jgi:cyclic lactone autoinducer peptide